MNFESISREVPVEAIVDAVLSGSVFETSAGGQILASVPGHDALQVIGGTIASASAQLRVKVRAAILQRLQEEGAAS